MNAAVRTAALMLVVASPLVAQPPEVGSLESLAELLQYAELPKHALVIGNQEYTGGLPSVTNAYNDARAMEEALSAVDFNVDAVSDLERSAFFLRLDDFVGRALAVSAPNSAVVAFYFAGHGFRIGGENFLVPIDASLGENLPLQSIPLSHIVERVVDQRVALALFFLDACRTELSGVGDGAELGFVEPQGSGLEPVYYGFASAFGTPSLSFARSDDANSPFAKALATWIGSSADRELHDLFEGVRREVAASTQRSQVPTEHKGGNFLGEHYFRPSADRLRVLEAEAALALLKSAARRPTDESSASDAACYVRGYLERYPTSPYSTSARHWLLRQGLSGAGFGCS